MWEDKGREDRIKKQIFLGYRDISRGRYRDISKGRYRDRSIDRASDILVGRELKLGKLER